LYPGISTKTDELHQFLALFDVSGSNNGATVSERGEKPSFRFGDREEVLEVTGTIGIVRVPDGIFIR
jgi:hypothetical protein